MAAPSIVFFGGDDSLRVPVLTQAGFRVEPCETLAELARVLDAPNLDAVICSEEPGRSADAAAELARGRAGLVLVLFQHPCTASRESLFNLVVSPGTSPGRWLLLIRERIDGLRSHKPPTSSAAAEKAWSEIARDLRALRRGVAGVGDPQDDSRDASGPRRIQLRKRSRT